MTASDGSNLVASLATIQAEIEVALAKVRAAADRIGERP
jgi:hypothetical protein